MTPNASADANAARADASLVVHAALVVAAVVADAADVLVLVEAVLVAVAVNVVAATRKERKADIAVGHRRLRAAAITDVEVFHPALRMIARGPMRAPTDPVALAGVR